MQLRLCSTERVDVVSVDAVSQQSKDSPLGDSVPLLDHFQPLFVSVKKFVVLCQPTLQIGNAFVLLLLRFLYLANCLDNPRDCNSDTGYACAKRKKAANELSDCERYYFIYFPHPFFDYG